MPLRTVTDACRAIGLASSVFTAKIIKPSIGVGQLGYVMYEAHAHTRTHAHAHMRTQHTIIHYT